MKTLKIFFVCVFTIAFISCSRQKKSNQDDDIITVGVILPLTGEAASWGVPPQRGLEIALNEINEKRKSKKIKLLIEDSQCDPRKSVALFNKLIIQKPVAIIGDVCSSATLALAPLANKNNTVLISPASTNPKITEAGDYVFRVIPSDEIRGKIFSQYMVEDGVKNVAILYINNDGGKGNEISFTKYFIKFGGTVNVSVAYDESENDFKTILYKIKKLKPQAILCISQVNDATNILITAKRLNLKLPFYFQSEALDDPKVLEGTRNAADGVTYISFAEVKNASHTHFSESYLSKFKTKPELFASEAYDALKLIGKLTGKPFSNTSIKDSLYRIKNYEGASGTLTFDENGDVLKPLVIKQIINQQVITKKIY